LGVDYVIFVAETVDSIEQTLTAIVLSATTSLLSFGLLRASKLPVISDFGLTVLIGNSFNLFGSLALTCRNKYRHPECCEYPQGK
jgi:predicted exporter